MTFAFDSFSAFLQMGKHGFYVWLSYGFSFVVVGIYLFNLFRDQRRTKKQLAKLTQMENK